MLTASLAFAAEKPRVAVLQIKVQGVEASAGPILTDWLQGAIIATKAFAVMERARVKDILDEKDFAQSDCTENACAVKAGKLLNVQKVIVGSVGQLGKTFAISVRMVDVPTGRAERQARKAHTGDIGGLVSVMDAVAAELATGVSHSPRPPSGKSYLAAMAEARRFLEREEYDQAVRAAGEALAAKPGDFVATSLRKQAFERQLAQRIDKAEGALGEERLAEAESFAREVLAVQPGHLPARRILERVASSRAQLNLDAEKTEAGRLEALARRDRAAWRLRQVIARQAWSELAPHLQAAHEAGLSRDETARLVAAAGLVVRFQSEPAGAPVFLDGAARAVGRTPCEWPWDGRDRVSYRLTLDKYFDHEGTLRLEPARRAAWQVDVRLEEKEKVVRLRGGVNLELVWIPPGEFLMGSPDAEKDRDGDEGSQHRVRITKGFWMGKYEVTQEQWELAMNTRPWANEKYAKSNPRHAVSHVSWEDCQDFLKKLNSQLRVPNSAFRLPTEAEWEYACRAGATTRFYYGDDLDYSKLGEYAWYDKNAWGGGDKYAHPVGQKKPNGWGLHDMHGNVWEWCQDWYGEDYYGKSPSADPKGPSSGSSRVLRGGSWFHFPRYCRAADRSRSNPTYRATTTVFGLCRLRGVSDL